MAIVNGVEVGNCGSCPEVMHCFDLLKEMDETSRMLEDVAFNPFADEHADELFKIAQNIGVIEIIEGLTRSAPKTPTELLLANRQQFAKQLDHIDEHKTGVHDEIEEITTDCEGPLKMRAIKAGKVVTATICTSPTKGNGFSCEDVHIQRDNISAAQHSGVDGQS